MIWRRLYKLANDPSSLNNANTCDGAYSGEHETNREQRSKAVAETRVVTSTHRDLLLRRRIKRNLSHGEDIPRRWVISENHSGHYYTYLREYTYWGGAHYSDSFPLWHLDNFLDCCYTITSAFFIVVRLILQRFPEFGGLWRLSARSVAVEHLKISLQNLCFAPSAANLYRSELLMCEFRERRLPYR